MGHDSRVAVGGHFSFPGGSERHLELEDDIQSDSITSGSRSLLFYSPGLRIKQQQLARDCSKNFESKSAFKKLKLKLENCGVTTESLPTDMGM